MNELDRIGTFLMDLPVYLANGGLVIGHWVAANSAALVSLLCAALLILLPDAEIQQRAGFRQRTCAAGVCESLSSQGNNG